MAWGRLALVILASLECAACWVRLGFDDGREPGSAGGDSPGGGDSPEGGDDSGGAVCEPFTTIGIGTTIGDNSSGVDQLATCGSDGVESIYAFVPASSGTLAAVLSPTFDAALNARGDCLTPQCDLGCVNASSAAVGGPLTFSVHAGRTVYIIVDGMTPTDRGSFSLDLSFAASVCGDGEPTGDEDCDPPSIYCDASCSFPNPEVEPNDGFAIARAAGTVASGELAVDDEDFWSIPVTGPGGYLRVDAMTSLSGTDRSGISGFGDGCNNRAGELWIGLFDADASTMLFASQGSATLFPRLSAADLDSGTYYVQAMLRNGATLSTGYGLRVVTGQYPNDSIEPNDDVLTAQAFVNPLYGTVDYYLETDYYTFSLGSLTAVSFCMTSPEPETCGFAGAAADLTIQDPGGGLLSETQGSTPGRCPCLSGVEPAGPYILAISGTSNDIQVAYPYRLDQEILAVSLEGSGNDTPGAATTYSGPVIAAIDPSDDVDCYAVTATASGTLDATVSDAGGSLDHCPFPTVPPPTSLVDVWDGSTELTTSVDVDASGCPHATAAVGGAGVYVVCLGRGGATVQETGAYRLTVAAP